MLTVDEQIQLAERIADGLPGVSRNEWMRWMQVASGQGLPKAVRHAERLSADMTMRPEIQRANRLIAKAVKAHMNALQPLPAQERNRVLGYVSWWLRIRGR